MDEQCLAFEEKLVDDKMDAEFAHLTQTNLAR